MNKSTLKEVAEKAQVSPATVSRAIRNPHLVKHSTLERIQKVIQEIGYANNRPNLSSNSIKMRTIGLIVPTIANSIFTEIIRGMQISCREENISVIIGHTDYSIETEHEFLRLFIQRGVMGIVQAGIQSEGSFELLEIARKKGIHSVIICESRRQKHISSIEIDNYSAAYAMTQHLYQLGHRRMGLIIGPYHRHKYLQLRLEGYRNCLECHNIDYEENLVVNRDNSMLSGSEAMRHLINQDNRPTAVFAASDILAMGAMTEAKRAGLKITDDISIAGFDNIEFAAFADPPLTTVHVPGWEMGQQAVRMLIEIIDNDCEQMFNHRYLFDTPVVYRSSTGCSPRVAVG